MKEETVTISLEKYEEMKREIFELKQENKQKTIYKYDPINYGLYIIILFLIMLNIHKF